MSNPNNRISKTLQAAVAKIPSDENFVDWLDQTYQGIAPDFLVLFPRNECKGKVLQETVPDYLSPSSWGGFGIKGFTSRELYDAWKQLDREEQDRLLEKAFPARETFGF